MTFRKFLLTLVLLAAVARPAQAQFVSIPDASIGYAEGNQSGNLVLTLSSAGEAVAQRMTFDADAGRWVGFGSVDYDGAGLSVHVSDAAFSVRVEAFVPPPGCNTPVSSPARAAHIEARDSAGNLILVAGNAVVDISHPCPQWKLSANIGPNLPATLALMKPRYRNGVSASGAPNAKGASLGSVKAHYRTVTGRIITF